MKRLRHLGIPAVVLVAAFCFLIVPVAAQCPEGDPDCPITPPQSQEVGRNGQSRNDVIDEVQAPGALAPLNIAVPALPFIEPHPFKGSDTTSVTPPVFDVLQIPLRRQNPADVSCGVQALGMALAGLEGAPPASDALLAFLQHEGWMHEFGTSVEGLALAAQYFGYQGSVSFEGWTLEHLAHQVAAGKPVVVALGANGPDRPGHFVTVTGISPSGDWIAFNDPTLGRQVLPVHEFSRLWGMQSGSGVAVATAPPPPATSDKSAWTALAAAMLASIALAPSMLGRKGFKGVGGALENLPSESVTKPPYPAPVGYEWKRIEKTVYEWRDVEITRLVRVPTAVYKKVQVGTRTVTEHIPVYKTVVLDQGHWEKRRKKKFKWVTYVKSYKITTKKVPDPNGGWTTIEKKVPVYAKKKKYYYEHVKVWVPNLVEIEVPAGHMVIEREEPVYEWQWVPETKLEPRVFIERRQVPVGTEWQWELEPLPVEKSGTDGEQPEKAPPPVDPIDDKWDRLEEILVDDEGLSPPGEGGPDIIEELRNSGEKVGNNRIPMEVTNPLHIRSKPGSSSMVLAYALPGQVVYWTGRSQDVNGTAWYQVKYRDAVKGVIKGWACSKYLREIVEETQEPGGPRKNPWASHIHERLVLWRTVLTPEERAAILEQERRKLEELWWLLQGLSAWDPDAIRGGYQLPNDGWEEYQLWLETLESLFLEPDWYVNGGAPPAFLGIYQLSDEMKEAFQSLLFDKPLFLDQDIPWDFWEKAAKALDMTTADLMMVLLETAPWTPEEPATAGAFPVTLYVNDPGGVRLRKEPSDGSESVTKDIGGAPYAAPVTWRGKFHVGEDGAGNRRVYYHVAYTYPPTGKTYEGWVPCEYLSPDVESLGPQSGITGPYPFNTFGYGGGALGWQPYYTSGAAQNLNLELLFKNIGDPDYSSYANPHKNLCGQLSVMEAVYVSLEEGFGRFRDIGESYRRILQNPNAKTDGTHLIRFLEEFGLKGKKVVEDTSGRELISKVCNEQRKVLALVNINPSGNLDNNGGIAHWIGVKNIRDTDNGLLVDLYNPYINSYETEIPWNKFKKAWSDTPGNDSGYQFIWS